MFKTVTEFSIDREALLNSHYECCDRVSFTAGADKSDVAPAQFIASIIAKLIERGRTDEYDKSRRLRKVFK